MNPKTKLIEYKDEHGNPTGIFMYTDEHGQVTALDSRADFECGTKVTYRRTKEIGIIKKRDQRNAWVVFYCGEDWDNYQNYTASVCRLDDLALGWDIIE